MEQVVTNTYFWSNDNDDCDDETSEKNDKIGDDKNFLASIYSDENA